ncbi:XRE family transcriptional regulator [soil metagenome]
MAAVNATAIICVAANPTMVMLAREAKGLSQADLANALGVNQGTVSRFESGDIPVPPETVAVLADVLEQSESLFYEKLEFQELPLVFYRRRVKVRSATLKAIRARMNFVRMRVRRLLKSADVPELRIFRADATRGPGTPVAAARQLRVHWNLPPGPVRNVTRAMEDAGILVLPFDFDGDEVSALSVYNPRDELPPIVLYNPSQSGDRLRLTLAHELGHIVLHHHLAIAEDDADTEGEAWTFAREFLVPAGEIRGHLGNLNLKKLAALKAHWRVSMQMLIMHATALGRISERQQRTLFTEMNKHGYRKVEPISVPLEKPTLFSELIDYHSKELQVSEQQLSTVLHYRDPFAFRRECRVLPGVA